MTGVALLAYTAVVAGVCLLIGSVWGAHEEKKQQQHLAWMRSNERSLERRRAQAPLSTR